MPKTQKQVTGETGENIACQYLMRKEFLIKARNYRKSWGEIDIVAEKKGKLHFVEVKTVSHVKLVGKQEGFRPEENIHPWKLKRLYRAIQTYLIDHKVSDETNWQLDAAIVYLDFSAHKASVDYIENIV